MRGIAEIIAANTPKLPKCYPVEIQAGGRYRLGRGASAIEIEVTRLDAGTVHLFGPGGRDKRPVEWLEARITERLDLQGETLG